MNISSILSTKSSDVITISPDQTISEAILRLSDYNIGVLIVVGESGKVVGIISERDIVRRLVKDPDLLNRNVFEVMTSEVIVGVPQDDVMSVVHTMTEKRFRHIPVIDRGKLIGIVSIGDIVKAQRDQYQGQIDTLETQIMASDE
ncbi:MAG: CBS domain-containing protein [Chloroflexota bacterium]|jgi:CBS domain-containing protein